MIFIYFVKRIFIRNKTEKFISGFSMFRYSLFFLSLLLFFSTSQNSVFASDSDNPFCIVPIKNGTPTKADVNDAGKMVSYKVPIPDFPQPIYTPVHRGGVWTINKSREWVKYQKPSPNNIFDNMEKEPWSGRTVIVPMHPEESNVLVFEKNTDEFKNFDRSKFMGQRARTLGPYVLPSRKETIIIVKNIPYLVGENKFYEWSVYKKIKELGVTKIYSVHDAPSLGGVVIVTQDRGLFFFSDNNLQKLGQLYDRDYGWLHNLPDISSAIFVAQETIYYFRKSKKSGKIVSSILNRKSAPDRKHKYHYLKQFKQLIRYNPYRKQQKYKWEKLYKEGFKSISKNNENGVTESFFDTVIGYLSFITSGPKYRYAMAIEAPHMGITILIDRKKISIYNGSLFLNVLDNSAGKLGNYFKVFSLPSINKVLISSNKGIYELQSNGRIRKLDLGVKNVGPRFTTFIDWPSAGVALLLTSSAIYSLDKMLKTSRVRGGENIKASSVIKENYIPILGDVVLATPQGLVSVVNTKKSGGEICDTAAD